MDESRDPSFGAVISIHGEALRWLREEALPLWDRYGVDRDSGGYYEELAYFPKGTCEASGAVRRGRVVARQIYVFDMGHRLGWRSSISNPVDHGGDYLFSRLYEGDGRFHTSVDASTNAPVSPFSLYEQAFYLFALARLHQTQPTRYPVESTALMCLQWLRTHLGRAAGGFEESIPPSLPLKSNPHMHLLEAALAWAEVTAGGHTQPWLDLSGELVGLCLTRFRDVSSGGIREFFDYEWQPACGDDGRIMEPGHQFEWAWLLMQWSRLPVADESRRLACARAAAELVALGERGVDVARNVAINEMWDDMAPKDSAAKLWPQTERVKAWCAMLSQSRTSEEFRAACGRVVDATRGMLGYLRKDAPGMWHEVCSKDGEFAVGVSKASSLYHIVCAIDVLGKAIETHVEDIQLKDLHDSNG